MRDLKIAKIHYITTGFLGIKKQKETSWIPKASKLRRKQLAVLPFCRDSPMKMHDKFCHAQEDSHKSKATGMVPIPSCTDLGLRPSQRRYRQQASETFSADMATQPRHLGLMFIYQGNLAAFLLKINKPMQPKKCPKKIHKVSQPQAINSETYPRVIKHGNGGFDWMVKSFKIIKLNDRFSSKPVDYLKIIPLITLSHHYIITFKYHETRD